jgi:hypothetical protein
MFGWEWAQQCLELHGYMEKKVKNIPSELNDHINSETSDQMQSEGCSGMHSVKLLALTRAKDQERP